MLLPALLAGGRRVLYTTWYSVIANWLQHAPYTAHAWLMYVCVACCCLWCLGVTYVHDPKKKKVEKIYLVGMIHDLLCED